MSNRALSRSPVDRRASLPSLERPRPVQVSASRNSRQPGALARLKFYISRPFYASVELLFSLAVAVGLYISWNNRNEGHLTPENGAGYWLGIIGSVMMAWLLLYPVRKRMRIFRSLGRVPSWFRWHMILGIVGPALILVHSNWKFESHNAIFATVVMLVVVVSGIVGRYLYTKVHMSLYGRKVEVRQILADTSFLKEVLGGDLPQTGQIMDEMRAFEARILAFRLGIIAQMVAFLMFGIRRAMFRSHVMRQFKALIASEGRRRGWSWSAKRKRQELIREHVELYFGAITKAARFSGFERMFAAWHVFHMPLFFLLVAAAIIHIIAVHRF
jgi:hypothetical protein